MPTVKRALGKALLIALTLWALAMVVPDLYRLAHPLASFGFVANGDGVVTDALGPFAQEAESPAWRAGLRPGDRIDLKAMRCIPVQTLRWTAQAVLAGLQLVEENRHADLTIAAGPEFSGIFWAPVSDPAAGLLGGRLDSWIRPHSIRHWRARAAK